MNTALPLLHTVETIIFGKMFHDIINGIETVLLLVFHLVHWLYLAITHRCQPTIGLLAVKKVIFLDN